MRAAFFIDYKMELELNSTHENEPGSELESCVEDQVFS
jgi:hypothetical protein